MTALLDINDCNLQLWAGQGRVQSPGYALLESGEYRFGNEARGSARLRPRDINNRFWWQLSTEPLQPALGPARHTADLVHAHLLQIHDTSEGPEELLLACSGSMQREQLSLLLGIVQQCPFKAVALLNRSALLASHHSGEDGLFHLELQLHQGLLTELTQHDNTMSVTRTVALPGCGLLQLQERLVESAANAFIRQTRFDPRRKAATEQNLYDVLPAVLQTLAAQPEANIEVNGYRARVSAAEMAGAGQHLFTAAAQAMGNNRQTDPILVDPLVSLLPGLRDSFPRVQVAAEDALWLAAQQQADHLINRDGPLAFVSAVPCLTRAASTTAITPPPQSVASPDAQPTHLLQGARAMPLVDGMQLAPDISITGSVRGWHLCGNATVNGDAVTEAALAPGDRIELPDGKALSLIEVQS